MIPQSAEPERPGAPWLPVEKISADFLFSRDPGDVLQEPDHPAEQDEVSGAYPKDFPARPGGRSRILVPFNMPSYTETPQGSAPVDLLSI